MTDFIRDLQQLGWIEFALTTIAYGVMGFVVTNFIMLAIWLWGV